MTLPVSDARHWKRWFRCLLLLATWLLFSLPAAAGDYTVTYALDGKEDVVTGSAECEYQHYCWIKIENTGVALLLGFDDVRHTRIGISVHGDRRPGCCFFSDGVNSLSRDVSGSSLIRLSVYEGHFRKGNEFLQNFPIGMLYLKLSQQK